MLEIFEITAPSKLYVLVEYTYLVTQIIYMYSLYINFGYERLISLSTGKEFTQILGK